MEEHGEELQNNGQAAKVARKQMGPELDYSNNNICAVTALIRQCYLSNWLEGSNKDLKKPHTTCLILTNSNG